VYAAAAMAYQLCAEVSYRPDDTVLVRFLPGVGVEEGDAERVIAEVIRVSGERLHANLVDARDLLFMSNSARTRFAAQSPASPGATGIVINSSVQTMLANLYLNVARPRNPTKVFADETSATIWLRDQLFLRRRKRA
jgi:hypothetical protein